MGPGAADAMSVKADRTLQECDTIIGYTVYVNGLKNDEIRIRRLDPDDYRIRIDEDEKEIILNKKMNMW